jgi:hypothetical protein
MHPVTMASLFLISRTTHLHACAICCSIVSARSKLEDVLSFSELLRIGRRRNFGVVSFLKALPFSVVAVTVMFVGGEFDYLVLPSP